MISMTLVNLLMTLGCQHIIVQKVAVQTLDPFIMAACAFIGSFIIRHSLIAVPVVVSIVILAGLAFFIWYRRRTKAAKANSPGAVGVAVEGNEAIKAEAIASPAGGKVNPMRSSRLGHGSDGGSWSSSALSEISAASVASADDNEDGGIHEALPASPSNVRSTNAHGHESKDDAKEDTIRYTEVCVQDVPSKQQVQQLHHRGVTTLEEEEKAHHDHHSHHYGGWSDHSVEDDFDHHDDFDDHEAVDEVIIRQPEPAATVMAASSPSPALPAPAASITNRPEWLDSTWSDDYDDFDDFEISEQSDADIDIDIEEGHDHHQHHIADLHISDSSSSEDDEDGGDVHRHHQHRGQQTQVRIKMASNVKNVKNANAKQLQQSSPKGRIIQEQVLWSPEVIPKETETATTPTALYSTVHNNNNNNSNSRIRIGSIEGYDDISDSSSRVVPTAGAGHHHSNHSHIHHTPHVPIEFNSDVEDDFDDFDD